MLMSVPLCSASDQRCSCGSDISSVHFTEEEEVEYHHPGWPYRSLLVLVLSSLRIGQEREYRPLLSLPASSEDETVDDVN